MTLPVLGQITGARVLVVFLPGAGMHPPDFASGGFFEAPSRRMPKTDLLVVAVDPLNVTAGQDLHELETEILTPARRYGCQRIWLGGISLGGLLALAYNASRPGTVDGLCLLAPYPGSRLTRQLIEAAGGLEQWQPTVEQLADDEFRVWHWLKKPPANFPVFIGYGRDDRFSPRIREIAGRFPSAVCHTVAGAHDWTAWLSLWTYFLDHPRFAA